MKRRYWGPGVLILFIAFVFGSILLTAQENQTKTKEHKSLTVTGCLQKGDEAGEYSITGQDGHKYGLRSKTVDLSKHLGHKVTVTGTRMKEEDEGTEKHAAGGGEYADLRVTELKMVSEGCQ